MKYDRPRKKRKDNEAWLTKKNEKLMIYFFVFFFVKQIQVIIQYYVLVSEPSLFVFIKSPILNF